MVNWRHRRTEGSALVFCGFGLMLVSHTLFLFMLFNEYLFFMGQVLQLTGFLCMLVMLVKVNRTNAQGN
jgi:tryptophan-rich sensory protein